jgi:MerR family redox-sensitive transcriptional activator SoxR
MRIGELAEQANVSTSAVRYYEKVGLLPAPRRVSGRREYADDALARLAIVLHARKLGFSIAETGRLVAVFPPSTPSARWKTLAAAKLVEIDAIIAHAKAMRTTLELISECRCESWDQCGKALISGAARGSNPRSTPETRRHSGASQARRPAGPATNDRRH